MAAFHAEHSFEGLASYGGEEDMLIGEWGDLHVSASMVGILSRQLILESGSILQLQLVMTFEQPAELAGSTDWQMTSAGFRRAAVAMIEALPARPSALSCRLDRM